MQNLRQRGSGIRSLLFFFQPFQQKFFQAVEFISGQKIIVRRVFKKPRDIFFGISFKTALDIRQSDGI